MTWMIPRIVSLWNQSSLHLHGILDISSDNFFHVRVYKTHLRWRLPSSANLGLALQGLCCENIPIVFVRCLYFSCNGESKNLSPKKKYIYIYIYIILYTLKLNGVMLAWRWWTKCAPLPTINFGVNNFEPYPGLSVWSDRYKMKESWPETTVAETQALSCWQWQHTDGLTIENVNSCLR